MYTESLRKIIRPIAEEGSILDKMICLLTYAPLRLFRGFLVILADNIIKKEELCPGEKLSILLSGSKVSQLPLIIKLPDGNTFFLYFRDLSSFVIFKDIYDDSVYEKFYKIHQGDVILDIGAHVGVFTSKACHKKGFVIAIEPDPYNFNLLMKNNALNSYENSVIQIKAALGNKDGKILFYKSDSFSVGSSINLQRESSRQITVKVFKLDTLIDKLKIKMINFMKMDAEGAEIDIIEGAKACLMSQIIKNIAIAAYHISENERKQLAEVLRSFGYVVNFEPDGYIYAQTQSTILGTNSNVAKGAN